jgi:serine/threonine-protein kinase SRPK3
LFFPHALYPLSSTAWHVAIKILMADLFGGPDSVFELNILRRIAAADLHHAGYAYVARLLEDFVLAGPHGQHLCLVFNVLGESVSAFRRRLPSRTIPAALVRQIGRQIFSGLHYLYETCGVIHTGKSMPY